MRINEIYILIFLDVWGPNSIHLAPIFLSEYVFLNGKEKE